MDEEIEKEILSCIEEAMQGEGFSEMKIDLTGTNEKGEGYVADMTFATVTGTDKDNKRKEVHLAVKVGKRSKKLRENLPVIPECYRRETFFYEKILPTFRKFQLEKNIVNHFTAVPHCYKTFLSESVEALVMDNLKKKGFALHDKRQPMNLQHIQLVLKNYAKLHALSLALRDQKKEEFNELTANYDSMLGKLIRNISSTDRSSRAPAELREGGREDLATQLEELTKKGRHIILLEILDDLPQETVITHGDCHNNNFLFEYQDNDKENPLSVAIIDWQISELHSPVIDLSYFIYSASSKESLAQLDVLLRFYHSHLSDFLRELGSVAEKLFPYSKLVEHWRKYSPLSFIMTTGFLQLLYVEKEKTPSIEALKEEGAMGKMLDNINSAQRDVYRNRLIAIVDHFFNFKLK